MIGLTFGELTITRVSIGVPPDPPGTPLRILPSDADALAAFVRHDSQGAYRPLSGARTLPRGWEVILGRSLSLEAALEAIYPLSTVHQRQFEDGTLEVVPLQAVLERQTGRYEGAAALSDAGRELAISVLCGGCVRTPVWHGDPCDESEIPCPEPCSVLVALCREAALWEAVRPALAPADPAVPFAAFEEPGNELRERYLSAMIERDE